jgi:hypothetical protein
MTAIEFMGNERLADRCGPAIRMRAPANARPGAGSKLARGWESPGCTSLYDAPPRLRRRAERTAFVSAAR